MEAYETDILSFIIRIWLEETTEEGNQTKWRGRITHVPSGKRQYVERLDDINTFLISYLEAMGVQSDAS